MRSHATSFLLHLLTLSSTQRAPITTSFPFPKQASVLGICCSFCPECASQVLMAGPFSFLQTQLEKHLLPETPGNQQLLLPFPYPSSTQVPLWPIALSLYSLSCSKMVYSFIVKPSLPCRKRISVSFTATLLASVTVPSTQRVFDTERVFEQCPDTLAG